MPENKDYVMEVNEYINKNFATCKSPCNLKELYTAFKKIYQNVNLGSQSSEP